MSASRSIAHLDCTRLVPLTDWLAVGVAVALPWSTTAVGITIAAWLIIVLLSLDPAAVKREIRSAAGGLPVVLWCLGVVGMLWADVSWQERLAGLGSFHRLLAIPLLLAHFRRSTNGIRVVCVFFISSLGVLLASYFIVLALGDRWHGVPGVPVHDTIFQGTIFILCGFGAIGYAILTRGTQEWGRSIALLVVGAFFLTNFAFATVSRASVVIAPFLLVLLGWRLFRCRGILAAILLFSIVGATMWFASPVLRARIGASIAEVQEYRGAGKQTPIGEHVTFLQGSWTIIASAPVLGHGTGSIAEEFRRVTAGKTGLSGEATVNPHNQTFAVAIQLGLIGAIALWAMWIAHLGLFRGQGAVAWLGLIVVAENILSSTVHSHLFDFNSGWLYVFAVGVLGGMLLRERDAKT
jgi:O-antigen ligase